MRGAVCSVTGETVPSGPPHSLQICLVSAEVSQDTLDTNGFGLFLGTLFWIFLPEKAFLLMPLVQNKVKNVDLHMLSQIKFRFDLFSARKKDFCRSFLAHF